MSDASLRLVGALIGAPTAVYVILLYRKTRARLRALPDEEAQIIHQAVGRYRTVLTLSVIMFVMVSTLVDLVGLTSGSNDVIGALLIIALLLLARAVPTPRSYETRYFRPILMVGLKRHQD